MMHGQKNIKYFNMLQQLHPSSSVNHFSLLMMDAVSNSAIVLSNIYSVFLKPSKQLDFNQVDK
jgi:hypothetical protein